MVKHLAGRSHLGERRQRKICERQPGGSPCVKCRRAENRDRPAVDSARPVFTSSAGDHGASPQVGAHTTYADSRRARAAISTRGAVRGIRATRHRHDRRARVGLAPHELREFRVVTDRDRDEPVVGAKHAQTTPPAIPTPRSKRHLNFLGDSRRRWRKYAQLRYSPRRASASLRPTDRPRSDAEFRRARRSRRAMSRARQAVPANRRR